MTHIIWGMTRSLLLLILSIGGSAALSAAPFYVSANGRFSGTDVAGSLVSPNGNFSFSFVIDSNPTPLAGTVSALGFDVPTSNFQYALNGVEVNATPSEIRFNTTANGGLFDVIFGSGLAASEFSFSGVQAFSGATTSPIFAAGQYAVSSWTFSNPSNYDLETPTGSAVSVAPIPEPSSIWLMICGTAGLGLLAFRKSGWVR